MFCNFVCLNCRIIIKINRTKLGKMLKLNLPSYDFKIKKVNEIHYIFDRQRRKYVKLTPEEWVRQHFIRFLLEEKHFPSAYLAVEKELIFNGMKKRCDAVLYNEKAQPQMILEFKAPHVQLTQSVFDQVAVYNYQLNVEYFIVSNGIEHYCCRVKKANSKFEFLNEIPDYVNFLNQ